MSTSLPRELRSARLSVLAALAVQLGDVDAALAAMDAAIDAAGGPGAIAPAQLTDAAWQAAAATTPPPVIDTDDTVSLLIVLAACGHPSLPEAARIALMLRVAVGLSAEEVSRAFAVSTETMSRRLAWSAHRVRPLLTEPVPESDAAPHLDRALGVLLLIFDDGIVHPHCHVDLPAEALETTRVLVELFPADHEPRALLALMVLTRARRDARQGADGSLVPLEAQDRSLWHRSEIEEGLFLLRGSRRAGRDGPYHVRASIQATHMTAAHADETDWHRLLLLHDQLLRLAPSDAVALARATALGAVRGPQAALETVEQLGLDSHLYHATRAHLLHRLGREEEADRAWTAAVSRVRRASEHAELRTEMER